jgi:hypothetical protein
LPLSNLIDRTPDYFSRSHTILWKSVFALDEYNQRRGLFGVEHLEKQAEIAYDYSRRDRTWARSCSG